MIFRCLNFVFYLLIVFHFTCPSLNHNNGNNHNISSEHSNVRVQPIKAAPDDGNPKVEVYNVTFIDINGQEVRIVLNRTLVEDVDLYPFKKRAREDGFVKTSPSDNPFSVMILGTVKDKALGICSGSLLTRQWVLTAAHCTISDPKIDAMIVYAGGYSLLELLKKNLTVGSQIAKTKEFYVYPTYTASSDADIALVKAGPFNLTSTVNVVGLSPEPWSYHSYKECKITGFGVVQMNKKSKDDEVRKTHTLFVKKPCLCSFVLKSFIGTKKVGRYICSKPLQDYGLCPGDSGGGLVCDGVVRGVVMMLIYMRDIETCDFSLFPPGGAQCGSEDTLTVFQDTCPFVEWINSHVKLFNASQISSNCTYTGSFAITFLAHWSYILFVCFIGRVL